MRKGSEQPQSIECEKTAHIKKEIKIAEKKTFNSLVIGFASLIICIVLIYLKRG